MNKIAVTALAAVLLGINPAFALNDTIGVTAGSGKTANLLKYGSGNVINEVGICDATTENQCAVVSAGGAVKVDGSAVTQPISGTITANAGTNLNTSALATSANQPTNAAQASTTSGQTGPLVQCAVTTAAPTYTTAQTDPLSCDTAGNLRIVGTLSTGSLATSANQTNASQKSQIVDGSGNVIASTSNALNVNVNNANTNVNTTSDGVVAAATWGSPVVGENYLFNGTSWDRVRSGGVTGIAGVSLQATPSGGWTPKWFVAANSDNATNLKASAGTVHAVQVFGIGSAPAYLKFYNKATAPTCGSDTIVKQIMIPAASTAANGAGAIAVTLDTAFSTGISYCVVTGITAADDTSPAASTFVINIDWL